MILAKIKLYGTMLLGLATVILYAMFRTEQAGRAKDKVKGMIVAQKKTAAAAKATMGGLADEQEDIAKARAGNDKRNDFE